MRWIAYPIKCLLFGILAMQIYFAVQIMAWAFVDPSTTAFQRAERWRLCTWHWSCPIESRWVAYESISPSLKRAVLVSEDDIFFQHPGVRVSDMQKAWEKNQKQAKNKKAPVLRLASVMTHPSAMPLQNGFLGLRHLPMTWSTEKSHTLCSKPSIRVAA